jgi:micrococcal nuclease
VRDELGARDGAGRPEVGVVVRVVDGDTVHVRLASGRERVRYIGVDTPEVSGATECWGRRATAANARLVGGRRVRLRTDVERRDRYGRLLAYVERVADGLDVNGELLRRGHARALAVGPNLTRAARHARLARAARRAGRGLWGACGGH